MQLVIGGELVDGRGTEADPVLNPASEEVLAEIPSATVEDVFAAVDAARAAGPSWGSTTPAVRAAALLRLADLLDEHANEFARVEAANGRGDPAVLGSPALLCGGRSRARGAGRG
jgi:aminobutyraldehyde dehydrogenase